MMSIPVAPTAAEARECLHILQRLGEGGVPPEVGLGRINVGNDSYLRVLEHEYFGRQLTIGASFKLVQGYYGGGKTHFLLCVRELAWRHGFATAVVELSPQECPYDDTVQVYRAVARRIALPPQDPLAPRHYGVAEMVRDIVERRVDADGAGETSRWLRRQVGRAPCESHSYRAAVVALGLEVVEEMQDSGLAAWLSGEPVPLSVVRPHGVYETISKANGFTMLRCLTQMVVALGVPGTALLFDEVDRILSVNVKRSQAIGDNLRQVVDLCGRHQLPNTLFMYAVPPEFLRHVAPEYPALHQRLKSPVPLSVRSPQAVLIDLDKLDMEPTQLLAAIGVNLIPVFETARGVRLDRSVQEANAGRLAQAAVSTFFEVNHRRLFVKTWVDLLHGQLVDGERLLTDQEAMERVTSTGTALAERIDDDFADF